MLIYKGGDSMFTRIRKHVTGANVAVVIALGDAGPAPADRHVKGAGSSGALGLQAPDKVPVSMSGFVCGLPKTAIPLSAKHRAWAGPWSTGTSLAGRPTWISMCQ